MSSPSAIGVDLAVGVVAGSGMEAPLSSHVGILCVDEQNNPVGHWGTTQRITPPVHHPEAVDGGED